MEHILSCSCSEVILKSNGDGIKVRGKLLIFKGSQAFMVCKGCSAEVAVPLQLDQEMMKSLVARKPVFHYIKK